MIKKQKIMTNKKNNSWGEEFRDLYFIWNCPTTPAQRENVKSMSKRVEWYIRKTRKDAIKEDRAILSEEMKKEITGRLPAFPPKDKAKEFGKLKIFSVEDIEEIFKQLLKQ